MVPTRRAFIVAAPHMPAVLRVTDPRFGPRRYEAQRFTALGGVPPTTLIGHLLTTPKR